MFLIPIGAALAGAGASIAGASAALTPFLTAASLAGTATMAVSSLTSKTPKAQTPQVPGVPNPGDSLGKASADATARTKARLANGGQTVYTSPTGAQIQSGNLAMHTLLGS